MICPRCGADLSGIPPEFVVDGAHPVLLCDPAGLRITVEDAGPVDPDGTPRNTVAYRVEETVLFGWCRDPLAGLTRDP